MEGGRKTLTHLIETIWDEARVFISKNNLNEGIKAPDEKFRWKRKWFDYNTATKIFLKDSGQRCGRLFSIHKCQDSCCCTD